MREIAESSLKLINGKDFIKNLKSAFYRQSEQVKMDMESAMDKEESKISRRNTGRKSVDNNTGAGSRTPGVKGTFIIRKFSGIQTGSQSPEAKNSLSPDARRRVTLAAMKPSNGQLIKPRKVRKQPAYARAVTLRR